MSILNNPLICIVDKNINYRNTIIECLELNKYSNILSFDNGEDCYVFCEHSPVMVILDFSLGKSNWNGIEFMEEFTRMHPTTRFIFMSSNSKVELAVESIRKGAYDYIIKSKEGVNRLSKHLCILKTKFLKEQQKESPNYC